MEFLCVSRQERPAADRLGFGDTNENKNGDPKRLGPSGFGAAKRCARNRADRNFDGCGPAANFGYLLAATGDGSRLHANLGESGRHILRDSPRSESECLIQAIYRQPQ